MLARPTAAVVFFCLLGSGTAAQANYGWSDAHGTSDLLESNSFLRVAAHPRGGVVAAYSVQRHLHDQYPVVIVPAALEVVRWSETGQKLWSVRLTGVRPEWEPRAIRTDDRGVTYVGAAGSESFHVAAIDAEGVVVWDRSLPSRAILTDLALGTDGDVVAVGRLLDDAAPPVRLFVAAWSRGGEPLWNRRISLSHSGGDSPIPIAIGEDGNIAVACGFPDIEVAYLARDGALLWTTRMLGSEPPPALRVRDVAIAADGDVIVVGSYWDSLDLQFIARIEADTGTSCWQRIGPFSELPRAIEVEVARDGTIWAATTSGGAPEHVEILRFDAQGRELLRYRHDPPGDESTSLAGLSLGSAGQAWVAGTERSGADPYLHTAVVMQFDSGSNLDWTRRLETRLPLSWEWYGDMACTEGGDLVLAQLPQLEKKGA